MIAKQSLALMGLLGLAACQKQEETKPQYSSVPSVTNVSKDPTKMPAEDPLDCLGLITCAGECATDACIQTCVDNASDEGVARVAALSRCISDNACADDEACIEDKCATEVAACANAAPPATSDAFPARISGTTRDSTTAFGGTFESVANVVFVRDDQAGADAGYPTGVVAFYRVSAIDYRVTTAGACEDSAERTETDPDPFASNLLIERQATSGGKHKYGLAIGLSDGRTSTCNSDIGHSVSTDNTQQPETDLRTFKGSWIVGPRTRAWELQSDAGR